MLGQQFYHETMRKVVVAFGTIFNNINIVRKNNSGSIIQKMKVPLAYGPAQKFLTRLDNDPSLKNKVAVTLPRIGFEIANLAYDPVRKLNRVQKFKKVKSSDKNKLDVYYKARNKISELYNSSKYRIEFKLLSGDLLMMDNYRLLHGRTSYNANEGNRFLQGCYIDYDSTEGKLKHLKRELNI